MPTKNKGKKLLEHNLDTFPASDLEEHALIMQKIEKARKEIENGEGMDWEDFKKEMDKW